MARHVRLAARNPLDQRPSKSPRGHHVHRPVGAAGEVSFDDIKLTAVK